MLDTPVIMNEALLLAALDGLQQVPKTLPSKWFYDTEGSRLFEEITQLPEYYPSRTETHILRAQAGALSKSILAGGALVELGSGASVKTRLLIDAAPHLALYIPVDVADEFLRDTSVKLSQAYPGLSVQPMVADFTGSFALPKDLSDVPKTVFFPGSTIGNLDQEQAVALLSSVRAWDGVHRFILGADLVKSADVLIPAYDDAAGVTAEFNLNLLRRLNREIGATFDLESFRHEARWNADKSQVEMHLRSKVDQSVCVGDAHIQFKAGETIHTENSRKYTEAGLHELAKASGWKIDALYTDTKAWFAVAVLSPV
ncbi:L-histidine N(alpha)-methyltransferase [uncultured Roseobacter sp.]|uniref:L-histidine N(alpha)-methyltransferase n=1 Tax=uncultured Roseobacter sp. TaxID=114847 RepID=UPI002605F596|nr:L-histidine N(alpha)-methyltransferase [uncultured Roseobacter sp.]